MYLVACGVIGLGDLICETERGRPFGMSTVKLSRRDSRREEDDECLSREDECLDEEWEEDFDEECLDEELLLDEDLWEEDFSLGTSRMFNTRPVVGSVVDDWAGSWETW
jgi:hypothetical protein